MQHLVSLFNSQIYTTVGEVDDNNINVVLYGRETWSLKVRGEHRLSVFENRALRRIFGAKRDVVTGGWRKLHNEELYNLYCSPSIIKIIQSRLMRWAGQVARMGLRET
jgi:hypothetical protein